MNLRPLAFLLGSLLRGQSPDDLDNMKFEDFLHVKVQTATRTPLAPQQAPATVHVVTRDQIRLRRYRSVLDLLRDLPDIKVDEASDYFGFNSVTVRGLRGFSTQKLILLLDGVRITGPTNEPVPFLDNFPVHFAQQVEVMLGPGSALYGPDAFSGVVNIISVKDGQASEGAGGAGTGGLSFGRFLHQGRLGHRGHYLVAGNATQDDRPDLKGLFPEEFAGVASYRTGVFGTPSGGTQRPRQPLSPDFEAPTFSNALFLRGSAGGFSASLFHRYARQPSNTSNNPAYAVYNKDVFTATELDTVHALYRDRLGEVDSETSLTGQRLELNPRSNFRNTFGGMEHGYKYMYSATHRLDQQLTWQPAPAWRITGGLSWEESTAIPWLPEMDQPVSTTGPIRAKLLGTEIEADVYTVHDTQVGGFLQVEVEVSPSLSLVLGGRADHSHRYGGAHTPRVGLVWAPAARWTLKLLSGRAFLAPSPFDTYTYYGSFAGQFWHLPNPGLRPQTLLTHELSLRRALGEEGGLTLDLYQTRVRDLFMQADDAQVTHLYHGHFKGLPVEAIQVFANQGFNEIHGGTLQWDHRFPLPGEGLGRGVLALSYVDGTIEDAQFHFRRLELANVAPWQLRVGGDLRWRRWSASPRILWVGRQRRLDVEPGRPDRRRDLPGYTRLDLTVNLRTSWRADVFLDVQNATNARYYNVGAESNLNPIGFIGTPQNPRRLTVGLSFTF